MSREHNINYFQFGYLNKMELQRLKIFMQWSQWHKDISGHISRCMVLHSTVLSPT